MRKSVISEGRPKYVCPVCKFDGLSEPPYNSEGSGPYEICPCCGFEFGVDDFGYNSCKEAHAVWRKQWIDRGCLWQYSENKKPKDWDPVEQLKE